jgi:HAMP domain-containing protein
VPTTLTIRAYLFLLTLAAALPVLGFAVYVSSLLVDQDRESIRRGAMDRTRALTTAIDAELRGSITSLRVLATSQALEKGDLRAFRDEVARALPSQTDWMNILLSLPSGVQIVNARVPLGVPLPNVLETESSEAVVRTGQPAVGSVVIGPIVKVPNIPVRVPIVQRGKVAYVLSAAVKPETFATLVRRQNLPKGWVISLIDSKGRFIARVPAREPGSMASASFRKELERGSEGWFRGATVDDVDTFTAYFRSPLTGWTVGFAIPAEVVEAGARRTTWLLGLGALASIALALFLAMFVGRRISGPLVSLAASARAIGRGEPVDTAPAERVREIGVVADALQEAGSAVRAQHLRDEKRRTTWSARTAPRTSSSPCSATRCATRSRRWARRRRCSGFPSPAARLRPRRAAWSSARPGT